MSDTNAWMIIFTNPANNYVSLVSTPLYLYDHLITFGDEVKHVWNKRLSGATVMFVLNRYAALLACFVNMFGFAKCHFTQELDLFGISRLDICEAEIRIVDICTIIAYIAFAGFAALRIYALYGLSKRIFCVVLALGLINAAAQVLILATYSIAHINITPGLSGCFRNYDMHPFVPLNILIPWQNPLFWQRIYMLAYEAVLVMLTLYKTIGYRLPRNSLARTPITMLLRRDGTTYFILLLLATALNVVGLSIPNNETSPMNCIGTLVDTLASIFMSHFILNLRSVDTASVSILGSLSTPQMTRGHPLPWISPEMIVGNLGESMRAHGDEDEYGGDVEGSGAAEPPSWNTSPMESLSISDA